MTSLLHAVMHTVVFVMTTVMLNPRFCKFRGHIILFSLLTAGRFTEAYTYARILSLRCITASMYHSISNVIIASGYPSITIINKIIGSIISFLLFKVLIANFDYYGAAWGQVLSFAGMTIVGIIVLAIKKRETIKRIFEK